MSFDGKAVDEGDLPPRRMAWIGPISCLQDYRLQQSHFYHLAANAVDLHPIAGPNAVRTHQYEPADESDNEVLQGHSQSSSGKSQHCSQLVGRAKDHYQDQGHPYDLYCKARGDADSMPAPAVWCKPGNQTNDQPVRKDDRHQQSHDPAEAFDHSHEVRAFALPNQGCPVIVNSVELLKIARPLIKLGKV